MNNLLQFVIRYSAFLLFLLLEIVAVTLVVRYNENQQSIFNHSSSILVGKLYEITENAIHYNRLQVTVDSFAIETALLKETIFNLERSLQKIAPAEKPLDSCILETYQVIEARVISNTINQRNNHFTIDRGFKDGVTTGMGVVSAHGIAGIIDHAGAKYSTATSILHSAVRISASIQRNEYFGALVWKEIDPGYMILEDIPKQAIILVGDSIVTSGYSFIFPKGIFIGTVESFWTEGGSNYYTVEVRLHEDIARLNQVYVINFRDNELKPE